VGVTAQEEKYNRFNRSGCQHTNQEMDEPVS
jgi:hypothetical protein